MFQRKENDRCIEGEDPDMCVCLTGANWPVHPHTAEGTTGAGRRRERSGRGGDKRTGSVRISSARESPVYE